jgi:hypothetical protein
MAKKFANTPVHPTVPSPREKYCAICDVRLPEGSKCVMFCFIRTAVEGGLRPPPGKLRRTAQWTEKTEQGILRKEAEYEEQWVAHMLRISYACALCESCAREAWRCYARAY